LVEEVSGCRKEVLCCGICACWGGYLAIYGTHKCCLQPLENKLGEQVDREHND